MESINDEQNVNIQDLPTELDFVDENGGTSESNSETEEEEVLDMENQALLDDANLINDGQEAEAYEGGEVSSCIPNFLSLILFSAYFLGVTAAIIVVLIVDRERECDQPLELWSTVQLVILIIGLLVRIWTTINLYKRDNLENVSLCWRIQTKVASFLQKLTNMFWSVWFIIGMVWTFNSSTCSKTAPSLYILSLTIVSINLFLIGMCILCCVCAFVCFGIIYYVNPDAFSNSNVEGAPKKLIEKLETKKFVEGLFADVEDAKCAICLSPYETSDELRFLPCKPIKHHFHRNCVDEWLVLNKTCPFCKRPIDEDDKKDKETQGEGVIDNVDV